MTQPTELTSGAATFEDAMAWRASQVEEYGSWVAAQDIYHGNALAYTAGDPVPASNVKQYDYDVQKLVVRPKGWEDPVPGDGIEDAPNAAPADVSTVETQERDEKVQPTASSRKAK